MYAAPPAASIGKRTPKLFASACIVLVSVNAFAADPPPGLARRAAERESASEEFRSRFAYQQNLLVEEIGSKGVAVGQYRERREVIFSPSGDRTERLLGKPVEHFERLRMTPEDFRDLREIQPLLLTKDRLKLYTTEYRGEEVINGIPCWVLRIQPRQLLDGQRLFEGLLWIAQDDYSVVQSEGRAVPQIMSTKEENLFVRFRTIRKRTADGYWFPVLTVADDTLPFRTGPLRLRMRVEYTNYQRFGAETTLTFDKN
ncbi:MAG: outer membrane lipoprotein-sorting protein [Acidobacteria bacterium]|nr:outer membrane lipoprotein-sorting protein [Acidobacteriota bacterium]